MARKVTITLEDEVLDFVDSIAANRSGFINRVLAQERKKSLEEGLEAAYRRDAQDRGYLKEAAIWDATAGDGVDA